MAMLCEVCGKKPPCYIVSDNNGKQAMVCRLCRPIFTSLALRNELGLQLKIFYDYLENYKDYLNTASNSQSKYIVANAFPDLLDKLQNRITGICQATHYGRRAKNKVGIIDPSVKIPTPPQTKPKPSKSKPKTTQSKAGKLSPKAKYNLTNSKKTWQKSLKKKKK